MKDEAIAKYFILHQYLFVDKISSRLHIIKVMRITSYQIYTKVGCIIMKNDKLDKILEEVRDIGKRVEALEKQSDCGIPTCAETGTWLDKTYPEGYITPEELQYARPDVFENCHQVMCGMVLGDQPKGQQVIHPIVPMMFHDGMLGYAFNADKEKVCFAPVRDDLPVLIGSPESAEGMYVPFGLSKRGVEVAKEIINDIYWDADAKEFEEEIGLKRIDENAHSSPVPFYYTKGE